MAINRALDLVKMGREVTLVDLDTVEPFYTLRPIKSFLTSQGLEVVAWETKELKGLGETGVVLHPDIPWVLRRRGDVILDVGYGVGGARTLNLVEGARESKELRIIAVVNVARPITASRQDIVEYIRELGPVHAVLNNSHLGDATDLDIINEGARVVTEAAQELGLPVEATVVEEKWREKVGPVDIQGNPVRYIRRYMKDSFW
ncbi:MAG: hypothetical protein QHH02_00080 [Syntrophomonadaceae bacterium]|nr:hypothetical protein [Syntrophomonadaceae bacterium]